MVDCKRKANDINRECSLVPDFPAVFGCSKSANTFSPAVVKDQPFREAN